MIYRSSVQTSYYITGSFSCWEPVKMQVEAEGVYAFTMVLGENRWESFQIWEDGDSNKVLHPGTHWADQDAAVLGPSPQKLCGRFATWRLCGKPTKVRLLNEEQARELDVDFSSEEMRTYVGDVEFRLLTAFPGDYQPEGLEDGEAPVVDQDPQLLGMPGDCYRVWLRLGGKYRRVEWQKLSGTKAEVPIAASYYLAGDFNFWDFQPLEEEASSGKLRAFHAEVQLRSSEDVFQVVRNKDWDQAFYPEGDTEQLRGPDGCGTAKGWRLPGKAGDVFRIRFTRTLPSSGADEKHISWTLQRSGKLAVSQEVALRRSYCIVGSWTSFVSREPMTFEASAWVAEVTVGSTGREFFQLLLDGNWLAAVYPNADEADFQQPGHAICGPDSRGAGRFWRLEENLTVGDKVRVILEVDGAAMPKSLRWQRP
ncbi:unnamed protein product [Effrenium voratum]|uniref:Uncharacterized protein n=1 Tax=Effrenium voratum TaxID=2562239 RepID=A0AA36NC23_9DINO|nr:unnamed protein product [Effrenium voratum]